jgi:hypothetical protein
MSIVKIVHKPSQKGNLLFLVHNVILHPLAGLLWFIGLERFPDWLHGLTHE